MTETPPSRIADLQHLLHFSDEVDAAGSTASAQEAAVLLARATGRMAFMRSDTVWGLRTDTNMGSFKRHRSCTLEVADGVLRVHLLPQRSTTPQATFEGAEGLRTAAAYLLGRIMRNGQAHRALSPEEFRGWAAYASALKNDVLDGSLVTGLVYSNGAADVLAQTEPMSLHSAVTLAYRLKDNTNVMTYSVDDVLAALQTLTGYKVRPENNGHANRVLRHPGDPVLSGRSVELRPAAKAPHSTVMLKVQEGGGLTHEGALDWCILLRTATYLLGGKECAGGENLRGNGADVTPLQGYLNALLRCVMKGQLPFGHTPKTQVPLPPAVPRKKSATLEQFVEFADYIQGCGSAEKAAKSLAALCPGGFTKAVDTYKWSVGMRDTQTQERALFRHRACTLQQVNGTGVRVSFFPACSHKMSVEHSGPEGVLMAAAYLLGMEVTREEVQSLIPPNEILGWATCTSLSHNDALGGARIYKRASRPRSEGTSAALRRAYGYAVHMRTWSAVLAAYNVSTALGAYEYPLDEACELLGRMSGYKCSALKEGDGFLFEHPLRKAGETQKDQYLRTLQVSTAGTKAATPFSASWKIGSKLTRENLLRSATYLLGGPYANSLDPKVDSLELYLGTLHGVAWRGHMPHDCPVGGHTQTKKDAPAVVPEPKSPERRQTSIAPPPPDAPLLSDYPVRQEPPVVQGPAGMGLKELAERKSHELPPCVYTLSEIRISRLPAPEKNKDCIILWERVRFDEAGVEIRAHVPTQEERKDARDYRRFTGGRGTPGALQKAGSLRYLDGEIWRLVFFEEHKENRLEALFSSYTAALQYAKEQEEKNTHTRGARHMILRWGPAPGQRRYIPKVVE